MSDHDSTPPVAGDETRDEPTVHCPVCHEAMPWSKTKAHLCELPTRHTPDVGTVQVCPTCQGDGRFVALDGNCPAKWAHRFLNAALRPAPETAAPVAWEWGNRLTATRNFFPCSERPEGIADRDPWYLRPLYAAPPAPASAPSQAVDDAFVDFGPNDGYARTVNKSAPASGEQGADVTDTQRLDWLMQERHACIPNVLGGWFAWDGDCEGRGDTFRSAIDAAMDAALRARPEGETP